jgi:hypothetical protein
MAFFASTAWPTTATPFCASSSAAAATARAIGAFRRLSYRAGDLAQRRRGLLEARRLLFGAAGKVVGCGSNRLRPIPHPTGARHDHLNRRAELADRFVEIVADLRVGRRKAGAQPHH